MIGGRDVSGTRSRRSRGGEGRAGLRQVQEELVVAWEDSKGEMLAASLMKIANHVRCLAAGPRCELALENPN